MNIAPNPCSISTPSFKMIPTVKNTKARLVNFSFGFKYLFCTYHAKINKEVSPRKTR